MSIAYFLTTDDGAFAEGLMPRLVERPEVIAASLFTPDQAEDPYVADKAPPALMLQIEVAGLAALDAVFADADIRAALEAAGPTARADVFETLPAPIAGVEDYYNIAGSHCDKSGRSRVAIYEEQMLEWN